MSDELIEGRALRHRRIIETGQAQEDNIRPATSDYADLMRPDEYDPPTDQLPWIVLEPPTEAQVASGVIEGMPTRPSDLPRFRMEVAPGSTTPSVGTPVPRRAKSSQPESTDGDAARDAPEAAEEPRNDSIMRLPRIIVEEDVPEVEPAPEVPPPQAQRGSQDPPSDLIPDFVTPPRFGRELTSGAAPAERQASGFEERLQQVKRRQVPGDERPGLPKGLAGWQPRHYLMLAGFILITLCLVAGAIWSAINRQRSGRDGGSDRDGTQVAPGEVPPAPGISGQGGQAIADRGLIAYSTNEDGDFEIKVLDVSTGEARQITRNEVSDRMPDWAPDGKRIVFVSDQDGDDDIYVINSDGSNLIQLTASTGSDRSPAWSPDGTSIVFSRETAEGSSLFIIETSCITPAATCENVVQPVSSDRYDVFPTWSVDGARIAFAASDFPGLPSVIGIVNTVTSSYLPLAGTGSSDFGPAWSPDGKFIAFVSLVNGNYDLYVTGEDGSALTQLTVDPANDVEPAWSPNAAELVFASERGTGDYNLYIMSASCPQETPGCEDNIRQLTDSPSDDLNPSWIGIEGP